MNMDAAVALINHQRALSAQRECARGQRLLHRGERKASCQAEDGPGEDQGGHKDKKQPPGGSPARLPAAIDRTTLSGGLARIGIDNTLMYGGLPGLLISILLHKYVPF